MHGRRRGTSMGVGVPRAISGRRPQPSSLGGRSAAGGPSRARRGPPAPRPPGRRRPPPARPARSRRSAPPRRPARCRAAASTSYGVSPTTTARSPDTRSRATARMSASGLDSSASADDVTAATSSRDVEQPHRLVAEALGARRRQDHDVAPLLEVHAPGRAAPGSGATSSSSAAYSSSHARAARRRARPRPRRPRPRPPACRRPSRWCGGSATAGRRRGGAAKARCHARAWW